MNRRLLACIAGATLATGLLPLVGGAASATVANTPNCISTQLRITVGRAQGTAGTDYYPLVFTNQGSACAVWGVPAVVPVVGPTHKIAAPAAHNDSMRMMPVRFTLTKGQSVSSAYGVGVTSNWTPAFCKARSVPGVLVTLGTFVSRRYVALPISVCTRGSSTSTRLLVRGTQG